MAVALLLVGCRGDFDSSDTDDDSGSGEESESDSGTESGSETGTGEGTGDTSSGTDSDTDGGELCDAATHQCVPPAPTGWDGPSIIHLRDAADPAPECPADFPTPGVSARANLDEGSPSCECSCGDAEGAECKAVTVTAHPGGGCQGDPNETLNVDPGDCVQFGNQQNQIQTGPFELADKGSCLATLDDTIPEPQWLSAVTGCNVEQSGGGCGGGDVCVANPTDPFEGPVCIVSAGDLPCPDGAYTERSVYYQNFEDGRACEDCSCAAPTGACTGNVSVGNSNSCNNPILVLDSNDCDFYGVGGAPFVTYNGMPSDAECEPSQSTIQGEVEQTGPITVCCLSG